MIFVEGVGFFKRPYKKVEWVKEEKGMKVSYKNQLPVHDDWRYIRVWVSLIRRQIVGIHNFRALLYERFALRSDIWNPVHNGEMNKFSGLVDVKSTVSDTCQQSVWKSKVGMV